jgi:hypothetical protein
MSDMEEVEEQGQELATLPEAALEAFRKIMESIPETDSGVATERIVLQLLGAETPEDLDQPWNGQGLRKLLDQRIEITEVRRIPSEFMSGPGFYLGCDATLLDTGETLFVTTGAISILAQLGRACQAGWLPLAVIPRQAPKPSRRGFYPMHLEITRRARQ